MVRLLLFILSNHLKEKTMTTRVETWQGHNIRFVLKNDEWWAILSDVCKAAWN